MLPPLAMCLVLTGIHGYLGIHVLSRKVIFVDLALAQIAALGSTYAVLLGYDPRLPGDGLVVYLFSLGFTFVGAAVFAFTRMRNEKIPQEAFVGIVYAMASAVALLLLAKSPGEGEHIKEMLVGNILLVTWPTVLKTAGIYAVLGVFHFVFRKPFFEISHDPDAARASGRHVRWWDFLFYASFGLVITSSVAVAGVLLVFSFLIVPAVIAFLYQERTGRRIVFAWIVGTACSAAGMLVSYYGDLPTGPSVVSCFAGVLVLASLAYYVRASKRRLRTCLTVVAGAVGVFLLFGLSLKAQKGDPEHAHDGEFASLSAGLESSDENTQIEAVHHLGKLKDPHALAPLIKLLDRTTSERVAEHIVEALPEFGAAATVAIPALEATARHQADPFVRLEVAASLLRLRSPAGFATLAIILDSEASPLVEQRAHVLIRTMTGEDFGLASGTVDERTAARKRFKEWLAAKGPRLRWRPDKRVFE